MILLWTIPLKSCSGGALQGSEPKLCTQEKVFVATTAQLMGPGQEQFRDGGTGRAFLKGRTLFPEMNFSKLSNSSVETVPCFLLLMHLLWCHSGEFS